MDKCVLREKPAAYPKTMMLLVQCAALLDASTTNVKKEKLRNYIQTNPTEGVYWKRALISYGTALLDGHLKQRIQIDLLNK